MQRKKIQFATKKDTKGLREKIEKMGEKMTKEFAILRAEIADKASKQELEALRQEFHDYQKRAFQVFATKEDLKIFATKEELAAMRQDIITGYDKVMKKLTDMQTENAAAIYRLYHHDELLENYEIRIKKLETPLPLGSA